MALTGLLISNGHIVVLHGKVMIITVALFEAFESRYPTSGDGPVVMGCVNRDGCLGQLLLGAHQCRGVTLATMTPSQE